MKIKTIALATCLVMLFCLAALAVTACDFSDLRQYYSTETFTKFDGEIERNVTIRVLENDTAISVGYFDELLDAFNARRMPSTASRRWMPIWTLTPTSRWTDLSAMVPTSFIRRTTF